MPNKQMHSDSKKRRSFLALLFAAGDLRRWVFTGDMHLTSAQAPYVELPKRLMLEVCQLSND